MVFFDHDSSSRKLPASDLTHVLKLKDDPKRVTRASAQSDPRFSTPATEKLRQLSLEREEQMKHEEDKKEKDKKDKKEKKDFKPHSISSVGGQPEAAPPPKNPEAFPLLDPINKEKQDKFEQLYGDKTPKKTPSKKK